MEMGTLETRVKNTPNLPELPDQEDIKKFAWHLKTMGGYVQEPKAAVVGLDENTVIASNDAAALYPTTGIYQNLGYDTLRDRIYDAGIVKQIVKLIESVFKSRDTNPGIIDSALFGFKNALTGTMSEYFKRKSVPNKREAKEFTIEYYPILLERILRYKGSIEDIYHPQTDKQYYLLKSCLYPILETVTWLSSQNRGYNQTIVDFIFFNDSFDSKYSAGSNKFYVFREINTTKTSFEILDLTETRKLFSTRVLNSYGALYDLHANNLSYDVEILQDSLSRRRVVKNQQLVLEAVIAQYVNLPDSIQEYFYNPESEDGLHLSERQADEILTTIKDDQPREYRIASLTGVEFNCSPDNKTLPFMKLRASQLAVLQLGIKVSVNSGYGVFAMPTWVYASPLIGNSFTNAGKIYGTKLFQAVSINILESL